MSSISFLQSLYVNSSSSDIDLDIHEGVITSQSNVQFKWQHDLEKGRTFFTVNHRVFGATHFSVLAILEPSKMKDYVYWLEQLNQNVRLEGQEKIGLQLQIPGSPKFEVVPLFDEREFSQCLEAVFANPALLSLNPLCAYLNHFNWAEIFHRHHLSKAILHDFIPYDLRKIRERSDDFRNSLLDQSKLFLARFLLGKQNIETGDRNGYGYRNDILFLHAGLLLNDRELVEKAVQANPKLCNAQERDYGEILSHLKVAIEMGHDQAAKALIENGAPLEFPQQDPLLAAFFKKWGNNEAHFPFFLYLLEKGASLTQELVSGSEVPLIEWLYFFKNKISPCYWNYLFYDPRFPLTERIILDIKLKLKTSPKLGEILLKRGLISQGEIELQTRNFAEGSREELLKRSWEVLPHLEKNCTIHHGAPEEIDPDLFTAARSLKKEMKHYLKKNRQDSEMQGQYVLLERWYDLSVERHPLFSRLRKISREFRKGEANPSLVAKKFYSLWSPNPSYTLFDSTSRLSLNFAEGNNTPIFEAMRNRSTTEAKRLFQIHAQSLRLTWVHGTRSPSLPGIVKEKALVPLGMLLKEGKTVPGNGENNGTEWGLNADNLSGERLSSCWQTTAPLYHEASTQLLISVLYATKSKGGYGHNSKNFSLESTLKLLSLEKITQLLTHWKQLAVDPQSLSGVRIAILRVKQYVSQEESEKILGPVRELIVKTLSDPILEEKERLKNALEELQKAMDSDIRKLSEQEKEWMHQNYPIVFASKTLEPLQLDGAIEFAHPGRAELGKDIQYVFTVLEKVDELQEILSPFHIQVFPFETAFYLETLEMERGEEILDPVSCCIPELREEKKKRELIAKGLEKLILPFYSLPFPPHPTYREAGKRRPVKTPLFGFTHSYEAYKTALEQGQIVPRTIHGRVHATRVAIGAQLIRNLRKRTNPQLKPLLPIEIFAAASHDWMREDEGGDLWDEESGEQFYHLARSFGASEQEARDLEFAIAKKDPPGRNFSTPFQEDLHDADCLEFIRVLKNPSRFQEGELCFYRNETIPLGLKETFIQEWQQWVRATESESFKKQIEWKEENTYHALLEDLKSRDLLTLHQFFFTQKESA